MEISAIHTLEHLMAVYIRSKDSGAADEMIYIGPMGCRTGMYLIMKDNLTPEDVLPLMQETFKYILDFEGEVPATTSNSCGNYLEHNLTLAKWEAKRFYNEILLNIQPENLTYPK